MSAKRVKIIGGREPSAAAAITAAAARSADTKDDDVENASPETKPIAENPFIAELGYLVRKAPLPEARLATIRLLQRQDAREEITLGYKEKLYARSLYSLNPGEKVNDEAIDTYAALLDKRVVGLDDAPYIFSTLFYTRLVLNGYDFDSVRSWTKPRNKDKLDLFQRRAVFFPINIDGVHWVLVYSDMIAHKLVYVDSLNWKGTKCLDVITRYLCEEYEATYEKPTPWTWTLVDCQASVPQQDNNVDCGVFMLMNLNLLHKGFELGVDVRLDLYYSQKDIANARQQIQLDTMWSRVYNEPDTLRSRN